MRASCRFCDTPDIANHNNRAPKGEPILSGQLLISLLSPSIGILFCAAFFLLWRNQRELNYSLSAAIGFLLSATGFVIQDILPAWPYDLQRIVSNLCFLAGVCAMMAAPLQRRQISPSVRTLVLVVALTLAALFWYQVVRPDLAARIAIVSGSLTIPVIITIVKLMKIENHRYSDRLIMGVLYFTLALFILRPVVAFLIPESFGNYTALEQSTYWGMVHFTYVLMAVTLAIALFVAIALDLTDELQQLATTDSLSGLLNRRGFEASATVALQSCSRNNQPACLMIADLDHFKTINDTHGHAAGDAVIESVGRHINEVSGKTAICGRLGGEEFAILLPDHKEAAALKIAEAIRCGFDTYGATISPAPTVSIGLAVSKAPATLSALLRVADKALYEAKNNGRNQVCTLPITAGPIKA